MQLTLSDVDLQALAEQIAPLISPAKPEPDWVKLKDVRDDLFAGKSPAWIRLFIFDSFPEVQIENGQPQAWVKGVHGQGSVTKIYLPYARKWMHEH
ncbi:hypothetical protein, partial [Limosilactobacillus fermentum]|uniref:hypothetical protein n=1 Tax=Limosilactobacillus fermentum TaxID=1613 RepID=UPI002F268E78